MTWWDWLILAWYCAVWVGLWYLIWQIGKHKGKAIEELDLDYLIWAMENVKFQDHKDAARAEIDRRQAQDILQFEEGVEEING